MFHSYYGASFCIQVYFPIQYDESTWRYGSRSGHEEQESTPTLVGKIKILGDADSKTPYAEIAGKCKISKVQIKRLKKELPLSCIESKRRVFDK